MARRSRTHHVDTGELHRTLKRREFQLLAAPLEAANKTKPEPAPKRPPRGARKHERIEYIDPPPITTEEEIFRHRGWSTRRALVLKSLVGAHQNAKQIEAFRNCGADCVVEVNQDTKKLRVRANYCHCRHCEPCMRSKGRKMAINIRAAIEKRKNARFRFVTLTLRHSDQPLADQISRLYRAFAKLRKWDGWKNSQTGGCCTLEVKRAKPRGADVDAPAKWHPHLHVIVEGNWLNQAELSAAWHHATGDSFMVDVRQLDSAKDAAFYVSKYVTKGTSPEVWQDDDAAQEWITAIRGRRLALTFGTWRGVRLMANPESNGTWRVIDRLDKIISDARDCHPYAIALMMQLKNPEFTHDEDGQPLRRPPPTPK